MSVLLDINFVKSVWQCLVVTLKKSIKFGINSVWYKLLAFGSTSFKISVMIDVHKQKLFNIFGTIFLNVSVLFDI